MEVVRSRGSQRQAKPPSVSDDGAWKLQPPVIPSLCRYGSLSALIRPSLSPHGATRCTGTAKGSEATRLDIAGFVARSGRASGPRREGREAGGGRDDAPSSGQSSSGTSGDGRRGNSGEWHDVWYCGGLGPDAREWAGIAIVKRESAVISSVYP